MGIVTMTVNLGSAYVFLICGLTIMKAFFGDFIGLNFLNEFLKKALDLLLGS